MRALQFKSWLLALKLGCDHRPETPEDRGLMLAGAGFSGLSNSTRQSQGSLVGGVILSKQQWGLRFRQPCPLTHPRLQCPLTLTRIVFPKQGAPAQNGVGGWRQHQGSGVEPQCESWGSLGSLLCFGLSSRKGTDPCTEMK